MTAIFTPRLSERSGKITFRGKETFATTFGLCSCSRLGLITGTDRSPGRSPFLRWQEANRSGHRWLTEWVTAISGIPANEQAFPRHHGAEYCAGFPDWKEHSWTR